MAGSCPGWPWGPFSFCSPELLQCRGAPLLLEGQTENAVLVLLLHEQVPRCSGRITLTVLGLMEEAGRTEREHVSS